MPVDRAAHCLRCSCPDCRTHTWFANAPSDLDDDPQPNCHGNPHSHSDPDNYTNSHSHGHCDCDFGTGWFGNAAAAGYNAYY